MLDVEFIDGSVLAQLGAPSMELPILYALTHPDRVVDSGVPAFDPVALGPLHVQPIAILHGVRPILGFRFNTFAYLTDCNSIPVESWPLLEGLDILVLDALRHRPHPTHFSVSEALAAVERMRPQQTYFTHVCHDLPHGATNEALPAGVELAYDGLQLTIEAAPAWT